MPSIAYPVTVEDIASIDQDVEVPDWLEGDLVEIYQHLADEPQMEPALCPRCKGYAGLHEVFCDTCGGKGLVFREAVER